MRTFDTCLRDNSVTTVTTIAKNALGRARSALAGPRSERRRGLVRCRPVQVQVCLSALIVVAGLVCVCHFVRCFRARWRRFDQPEGFWDDYLIWRFAICAAPVLERPSTAAPGRSLFARICRHDCSHCLSVGSWLLISRLFNEGEPH